MDNKNAKIAKVGYYNLPVLLMIAAIIPFPFYNRIIHLYQPILFLFALYILIFDFSILKKIRLNFFSSFCILALLLFSVITFQLLKNNLLLSLKALGEPAVVFESFLLSLLGYIIVSKINKNNTYISTLLKRYLVVFYFVILINLFAQLFNLFYNPTLFAGISYTAHKILPGVYERYSGLFPYPANAGLVIGVFLLQLICYRSNKKQAPHFSWLQAFIMFFTAIFSGFLTGSKVFIAFLCFVLIYIAISPIDKKKPLLFQTMISIIASIIIITTLSYFNHPSWWSRYAKKTRLKRNPITLLTGNRLNIGNSFSHKDNHNKNAGVIYKIYSEHLKNHWLIGIGPGKIKGYESETIFIFALGGIFILSAFYLMLLFFIYKSCKKNEIPLALTFGLYSLASFFIPVFFSNVIQIFVFESLIFLFLNNAKEN